MAFFGPIGRRRKDQVGNERSSRRDVLGKRPYQLLIFANITRKKRGRAFTARPLYSSDLAGSGEGFGLCQPFLGGDVAQARSQFAQIVHSLGGVGHAIRRFGGDAVDLLNGDIDLLA